MILPGNDSVASGCGFVVLCSLWLANSCLWDQGLGKGWLPAFPRFPPLSGFRTGRLLESPLAKRVESGSTKSVDSGRTLARASGQPMIKGPNFESGATARRFGNPKAMGKANLTFFMLQIALRARDRRRPDKSPRAHSSPRQPLHLASRCSTRMARGTVRRASRLPSRVKTQTHPLSTSARRVE
jgi:hypothetical protein